MSAYPWRFQADITLENPDPDVTVFVGDVFTNSTTGEEKVHQDTANPMIVKLSELPAFLTTAMAAGVVRETPPAPGAASAPKPAATPEKKK